MQKKLLEIMRETETMSPDEQLQLISYLIEKIKLCEINSTPKRNLAELEGIAPNLLSGMDATEYVKGLRTGEFPELEIKPRELHKTA